jgi:hypothetical protein
MAEKPRLLSRCFVRVWHKKQECRRTGFPILVVSYRLALDALPSQWAGVVKGPACFRLVFYNRYARERVLSVGIYDGCLRLALGPETFLGRWASEVTGSSGTPPVGLKQLVGLDVESLLQNVTAVTVRVAYAVDPQRPFRRLPVEWNPQAEKWIQDASFLEDFFSISADGSSPLVCGPVPWVQPHLPAVDILLQFQPRLFRCEGLH